MDGVPEGHQAPGIRQRPGLHLADQPGVLQAIGGAGDAGVNVAPDKAAENDDPGEHQGDPCQAVELPGGVEQHHERADDAGVDVELQPVGHAPPAGAARALAQAVQGFGEQHQDEAQDADGVPVEFTRRRNGLRHPDDEEVSGNQNDTGEPSQP